MVIALLYFAACIVLLACLSKACLFSMSREVLLSHHIFKILPIDSSFQFSRGVILTLLNGGWRGPFRQFVLDLQQLSKSFEE